MGQAVLHFEKHQKPSSGSLGHHIDRTPGREYSYRHADLTKTNKNAYIKVNELCDLDYNKAILARVEQGYQAKNNKGELKAIRKDAVYSINAVLSGSHDDLKHIENDPVLMDKWIQKNLEFCKKHFGEKNITRFAVHLDEKTPHIHCVFVPITADGRLSANDIIGTGLKLEQFQTMYAKEMAEFGLERGVKSDRKHHTTEEYRKRERYKLHDNKDILRELEELKQSDVFSFKSKKEALMTKLMNLILEVDETTKKEIEALKTEVLKLQKEKYALHKKNLEMPAIKRYFNEEVKEHIFNSFSLIDYFFHLANRGKLTFRKKAGNEYYFEDGNRKISVSEKGFYDFKSDTGGQGIKAVMEFERLNWYDSVAFMSNFIGTDLSHLYKDIPDEDKKLSENTYILNTILKPNNQQLMNYFENRGISKEVLQAYTKQVHFQLGQNFSFGIGLKNVSDGWDIRNEKGKIKLGSSNFSELGNGGRLVVFEGLTDMLSFVELTKNKSELEKYKFICLNSVTNTDKFIEKYQDFTGKIDVYLDAGDAADKATNKILSYFKDQAIDHRERININSHSEGYKDLNDYLVDINNGERKLGFTKEDVDFQKTIDPNRRKR